MKTLTEQTVELGTIEISVEEMKQAIIEYLKKDNYRAIDIPFDRPISVEVIHTKPQGKVERFEKNVKTPKFKRQNVGIYGALREYFKSEKDKGVKTIDFKELYPLVKLEYPILTEERLNQYLYDKEQFKNIKKYENKIIHL